EKELVGHSRQDHSNGFGSPIGKLKGINLAIEDMSPRDLKAYNIYEGETISLEFEGDIKVKGEIITGTRNLMGKIILITFRNCTVTHGKNVLFEPESGVYNMAVGERVISAFNGPADLSSFNLVTHEVSSETIKPIKSDARKKLEQYYEQIRHYREGSNTTISRNKVFKEIREKYPNDWLLPVELYELARNNNDHGFSQEIRTHLETVKLNNPNVGHLIDDGLSLVDGQLVNQ
ncbi:MAG: phenylalanine 4-monooxygenase, partial [Eudoraea sp.]|nr:phenylalanine 4-monooxygenase [Eudoraea sp.]